MAAFVFGRSRDRGARPARTEPEAPVDLMAALQASLDASKKKRAKPAKRRKAA